MKNHYPSSLHYWCATLFIQLLLNQISRLYVVKGCMIKCSTVSVALLVNELGILATASSFVSTSSVSPVSVMMLDVVVRDPAMFQWFASDDGIKLVHIRGFQNDCHQFCISLCLCVWYIGRSILMIKQWCDRSMLLQSSLKISRGKPPGRVRFLLMCPS